MIDDTVRLEWLLQNISGAEFRRLGIIYAAGCKRADIDKRMCQKTVGVKMTFEEWYETYGTDGDIEQQRAGWDGAMLMKSDYRQSVDTSLTGWGMVTTGDATADVAALIRMELSACLDPAVSEDASVAQARADAEWIFRRPDAEKREANAESDMHCEKCINRGKPCKHCIREKKWRQDFYDDGRITISATEAARAFQKLCESTTQG